jgi:hypothetical protein
LVRNIGDDLLEVLTTRRVAACCGVGYWLRHNLKVSLHRNKPLRGVLYSLLNVKPLRGGHSQSRSSSDSLQIKKPSLVLGFFIWFGILADELLQRSDFMSHAT